MLTFRKLPNGDIDVRDQYGSFGHIIDHGTFFRFSHMFGGETMTHQSLNGLQRDLEIKYHG